MKKNHLIWLAAASSMLMFLAACSEKGAPVPSALQKEIALGEKIFAEKECGKCHTNGRSEVAAEMKAPDLTSAFLANDTIFVKAHLQFIELSSMPVLDLTPQETRALAKYVANLHARTKTDPNLKNPDGACPVCGAPLQIAKAQVDNLQAAHNAKVYYFDCADCKRLFERAANWYVEHGYLATLEK
jgi:mono/diheme cytochrome c family protein/YHS domain-containing protein